MECLNYFQGRKGPRFNHIHRTQESADTDPSECRGGAAARLGRHDVHKGFGGIRELLNEHRTGHTVGRIERVNPERKRQDTEAGPEVKGRALLAQLLSESPVSTGAQLSATRVSVLASSSGSFILPTSQPLYYLMRDHMVT